MNDLARLDAALLHTIETSTRDQYHKLKDHDVEHCTVWAMDTITLQLREHAAARKRLIKKLVTAQLRAIQEGSDA